MSNTGPINFRFLLLLTGIALLVIPVHGFVANSLDITVDQSGNAVATFKFTLEGLLENAIPQSILEDELKKGLDTSSEPPILISMDRSTAILQMKDFADKTDVPTGTEYLTATMDFKKANIALKSSALSSVITANFAPQITRVTFPDGYFREFSNSDTLPTLTHIVIDPSKHPQGPSLVNIGAIEVTTSPSGAQVYVDNSFTGESPVTFTGMLPGTHNLSFVKDGFDPVTRTVTVTAGNTSKVSVILTPAPLPSPTPLPGFESVIACIAMIGSLLVWKKHKC